MRRAMRLTFFGHFCAGESVEELKPKMQTLHKYGIGGILDYAAEAKDESSPVLEVQHVAQTAEQETVGAPESARMYDYQGEAAADANAEIFFDAVRAVRDATPSGFAAIKISGLGNPMLLERMSQSLIELADFFAKLQREAEPEAKKRTTPFLLLDRSFQISYDVFAKGWRKWFEDPGDEKLREIFDSLDHRGTGKIDYLDWTNSMRLSELRALVLTCRDKGPLYRAALTEEEIELYFNMIRRVQAIFDLARDLGVRVMVDAEWCDIQPAINHIVLFLQRNYNRGDVPIVFQTYQTYLKGMQAQVKRDLERSKREGWRFGAKVVRGAYLVSEREKANQRGVESPVCETYEDTEENFHTSIDLILTHNHDAPDLPIDPVHRPAVGPGELSEAEILVASHNRESVEFTVKRMQELGKDYNHVHFGQLLGMADHLTFTLGMNGYNAYKYVPYGPIDEVVPYLIRRTQENSAILGSPGVFEERAMVTRELRRRLLRS
jgi:proline dehydrogenase